MQRRPSIRRINRGEYDICDAISEWQLHSRRQPQARGHSREFVFYRVLDFADCVIERSGNQIFEHFLVVADERIVNFDRLHLVLTGHRYAHHARARFAAYRDRRQRKRQFRALWIARINAGARENGMSYSVFMNGLKKASIEIDRKVLSDIAIFDKPAFTALVEKARAGLEAA